MRHGWSGKTSAAAPTSRWRRGERRGGRPGGHAPSKSSKPAGGHVDRRPHTTCYPPRSASLFAAPRSTERCERIPSNSLVLLGPLAIPFCRLLSFQARLLVGWRTESMGQVQLVSYVLQSLRLAKHSQAAATKASMQAADANCFHSRLPPSCAACRLLYSCSAENQTRLVYQRPAQVMLGHLCTPSPPLW